MELLRKKGIALTNIDTFSADVCNVVLGEHDTVYWSFKINF